MRFTVTKHRPPKFVRQKPHENLDEEVEEEIQRVAPPQQTPPPTPLVQKVQLDEVLRLREELFPTLSYEKTSPDSSSASEFHAASSSPSITTRPTIALSSSDQKDEEELVQETATEEEVEEKFVATPHEDTLNSKHEALSRQTVTTPQSRLDKHLSSLDELDIFLKGANAEERETLMVKIKSVFDGLLEQVLHDKTSRNEEVNISDETVSPEPQLIEEMLSFQAEEPQEEALPEGISSPTTDNHERSAETPFVKDMPMLGSYEDILRTQLIPSFEAIIAQPSESRDLTKLVDVVRSIQKYTRLATEENDEVYNETMQLILAQMSYILLDLPPQAYSSLMLNHEIEHINRDMDDSRMHPEQARHLRRFYRRRNTSR